MKPNILFIVIDSLRADRIFGEQKTASSPTIDSLIKRGTYFSNAITTNQYTSQVLQSIFTGRFLLDDEMTKNYSTKTNSLSNSFLSFLKKDGYYTCATCQEDVFIQGFKEKFDDDTTFKGEENSYNGLKERIFKKLDSFTDPWFYYIHFEDLHSPCVVPEELGHLKLTERYDRNISEIDSLIGKILKKINLDETLIVLTADHGEYVSPIQGQLNEPINTKVHIKNAIKKIIPRSILMELHDKKRTLSGKISATKTSKLHEKRILTNRRQMPDKGLFDDIIRIPLLFSGYGINSMPIINKQVCNIDIFPTIFELIGIRNTITNIHGRSLVPLLKDKDFNSISIYITSSAMIKELRLTVKIHETSIPLVGIRTQNFKYFRSTKDQKVDVHLYDLTNDPLEDSNIADKRSDVAAEMELMIEKIKKDAISSLDEEELDEEEIKRVEKSLKKLGYID